MGQSDSVAVKIRVNGDDQLELKGYRVHRGRYVVACLAVVLTFGLLLLLLAWRREFKLWMFYQRCPLQHATKVLVKDSFGVLFEEDVGKEACGLITQDQPSITRYFTNKNVKYIWDDDTTQFIRLSFFEAKLTCRSFHDNPGGLSKQKVNEMHQKYGDNSIRIILQPIYGLIFEEVSNPFYLFQFYMIILWMAEGYFSYSFVIIISTVAAVGSSVYETRKHMLTLKKRFQVSGSATVVRDGIEKRISTDQLVPGDILLISPVDDKVPFHCDAVLVEGICSVDESVLTGESNPITKMAVPKDDETFEYEKHKRHILFNGTQMLQGRPEGDNVFLKAVVIRTGFMTSKGELIRTILFPKPIHFRFYTDLVKVTALLLVIGLGGIVYSMYAWIQNGGSTREVIVQSLEIFTFVISPLLPSALTTATNYAQRRLGEKKIFSLSAKHISLCGGVDVACFDKTGTLTETDIDLAGTIPIQEGKFQKPVLDLTTLPETHPLLQSTATCHALIRIQDHLSGYSIDRKIFEATKWNFANGPAGINSDYGEETPFLVSSSSNLGAELGVLKRFPFESSVKRMTVIAKQKGSEHYNVFIKGAPETLAGLCDPVTVPSNYLLVLEHYTMQGYRVLALATKTLHPAQNFTWARIQEMSRDDIEVNSELIGLLVMWNPLKKETTSTIRILNEACIRTVMVTGDNLQTAVAVAKDCDIIDRVQRVVQVKAEITSATASIQQGDGERLQVHYSNLLATPECIDDHKGNYCFVMDGQSFELLRIHDPSLLDKCIHRGKVFARMGPADKQHLIEALQKIGRQVSMAGDGCNDCGALRAADAGVSLSMADASIAAPFISQETNISCVIPLICEGRTTLDAAFGTFLFSTGMNLIFFIGLLMLYSISTVLDDSQYLLSYFTTISIFIMSNASPPAYLHPRRPLRHLWAFLPLFSFFTFVLWQMIILLIGWFYCYAQPWFVPFVYENDKYPPNPSYEETTLYHLMLMGSIAAAFVFSPSQPYSRNVFSNKWFAVWAALAPIFMVCIMFISDEGFVNFMNFKTPPHPEYMVVILLLGVAGGLFCYCWEKYLIRGLLYQWAWPRINHSFRPLRHPYEKIEKELTNLDWPKTLGQSPRKTTNSKDKEAESSDAGLPSKVVEVPS